MFFVGVSGAAVADSESLGSMPIPGILIGLALMIEVNEDDNCRTVVLTAGRNVFCVGSDIKQLNHYPRPWNFGTGKRTTRFPFGKSANRLLL